MTDKIQDIMKLVDEQAEDEGLWFMAKTAPEAYLQQELRRLHAKIESYLPIKPIKNDPWLCEVCGKYGWHYPGCPNG